MQAAESIVHTGHFSRLPDHIVHNEIPGDTDLKICAALSNEPLPASNRTGIAAAHDVYWQLTASQLCDLLDQTADLPSISINPGLADPKKWKGMAFKGGSDTGILNLSTRLVGHDGSVHHVAVTWNDVIAPARIYRKAVLKNVAMH